jgi:hypothetical protein
VSHIPSSAAAITTSEERWRQWQERGYEQDARLMRRAKFVLIALFVALAASALLFIR